MTHYGNPALDAELAYRREQAMIAGRGTRAPGHLRRHRRWGRRTARSTGE
jgi:hypothetical protein